MEDVVQVSACLAACVLGFNADTVLQTKPTKKQSKEESSGIVSNLESAISSYAVLADISKMSPSKRAGLWTIFKKSRFQSTTSAAHIWELTMWMPLCVANPCTIPS